MLRSYLWASAVIVLLHAVPVSSGEQDLKESLDPLFKPLVKKGVRASVLVHSLDQGKALYELNPDQALNPASAIKVLTGYVALKRLGPEFTFSTEVWTQGKIQDGRLEGDLYIRGGGDPSMVTEKLYLLAAEVRRKGLKSISGSIYYDATAFDEEWIPADRIDQDSQRAYNAPVSALNLNYNSITLFARPGSARNRPGVITLEPENGFTQVKNHLKTGGEGSTEKLVFARIEKKHQDLFEVRGSIPLKGREVRKYFSINHPPLYFSNTFCSMLASFQVKADCSKIAPKPLPTTAEKLASVDSAPLREIVLLMNKYSNNFIAEALVKALGQQSTGKQGTTPAGLAVLNEEAKEFGVVLKENEKIVSGSGLTDGNRLSSRHFVTMLSKMSEDFRVFPELLVSLPIAGADGTLRSRLLASQAKGLLRAKTGTLSGVSALVGFVSRPKGERLVFSVLINGGPLNEQAFADSVVASPD